MGTGIFSNLGRSYFRASNNAFYYVGQSHLLTKPFALVLALVYSLFLIPTGVVFYALIILDWLGNITDAIRKFILNAMDNHSWRVDDNFFSFIFRPLVLAVLSPLFLISVFIPKVSSHAMGDFVMNELSDVTSGAGAFKQINEIIWRAAKKLFQYVSKAPLLVMPVAAVIAILYSVVLIVIGLIFAVLVPLDWLSHLIESMRQGIARFADGQQGGIRYSGTSFLFSPILMVVLAPLILFVLIIPKFSTGLDVEV